MIQQGSLLPGKTWPTICPTSHWLVRNWFIWIFSKCLQLTFPSSGQSVLLLAGISLDDLLVGVNRSNYYRYFGSLTTPTCNEAVVWTVFKDTIKVSNDLVREHGVGFLIQCFLMILTVSVPSLRSTSSARRCMWMTAHHLWLLTISEVSSQHSRSQHSPKPATSLPPKWASLWFCWSSALFCDEFKPKIWSGLDQTVTLNDY